MKEDISFDSLLSEIKNDQTSAFPKALQSILIDELLKTYNKDSPLRFEIEKESKEYYNTIRRAVSNGHN